MADSRPSKESPPLSSDGLWADGDAGAAGLSGYLAVVWSTGTGGLSAGKRSSGMSREMSPFMTVSWFSLNKGHRFWQGNYRAFNISCQNTVATTNQCCGSGSGIQCSSDPWIRDGQNSGSGMNIQDYFYESLEIVLWVKNTSIIWCGSGIRNLFDPWFGMEKLGSGINISDPQYWLLGTY
jgi:hypothetical protein